MSRDTECFSMYSDMSRRIIFVSLSNSSAAKALAISVLPTPVGPGKRKEPMGRFRLFNCAALMSTARAMASAASSCPRTRAFNKGPRWRRRSRSVCDNRCTGMPVQRATTSATSSAVTTSRSMESPLAFSASSCWMRFFKPGIASYLRSETVSKSPRISANCILLCRTCSFCLALCTSFTRLFSRSKRAFKGVTWSARFANSLLASRRRSADSLSVSFDNALTSTSNSIFLRSNRSNSSGWEANCVLMLAHASSTRSTALSGKNRVVM
mmetsp:Transcript_104925/g.301992  ORF Transcript_104925/g.301992 Transcript_104925/m.301992 type:complete len:268 (+) Transcript_104925:45-848(+)